MNSVSTARTFCKTARCPSSETLLRYRRRAVTIAERLTIQKHLRECDFCSAELHLLTRHKHTVDEPQPAQVPSHIRRLAESAFVRTRTLSRISHFVVYARPLSH